MILSLSGNFLTRWFTTPLIAWLRSARINIRENRKRVKKKYSAGKNNLLFQQNWKLRRFNYDQVSKTLHLADSTSSSDIVIQLNRAAKRTRKANRKFDERIHDCLWHRINPIEVLPRNRRNAPTTKLADETFPCSYRNKIYISGVHFRIGKNGSREYQLKWLRVKYFSS